MVITADMSPTLWTPTQRGHLVTVAMECLIASMSTESPDKVLFLKESTGHFVSVDQLAQPYGNR